MNSTANQKKSTISFSPKKWRNSSNLKFKSGNVITNIENDKSLAKIFFIIFFLFNLFRAADKNESGKARRRDTMSSNEARHTFQLLEKGKTLPQADIERLVLFH